jgi:GTP-binding protein
MEIRNIAIIAHVDHGKTTLTDGLMKQTGMSQEGDSMDSDKLEQERGITIYSKNTSVLYKDTKINIVDTPGHADFGSEVERILRSIDSVLLVVDAQEGPMPQTRFVLKKSLELGLKPIVVINKIDKPAAQVEEVQEMIYELFLELDANDEQLNFPTLFAIAKQGIAMKEMGSDSKDLMPILDAILEYVQPASSEEKDGKQLKLQPFNLAYDNFLGRLAVGRIYEGTVAAAQTVTIKKPNGEIRKGKINKLFTFHGLARKEVKEAYSGEIVMVAGLPDIFIGETICQDENQEALPDISIDEPTISLNFLVNDSPFAGREGKKVTNSQIKERLEKELEVNVGLNIDFSNTTHYKVFGRGELHIAILLENMRREGYELQVSQPTVIIKEVDGEKQEPYEEVTIDVPDAISGSVIEKLSKRKGIMTSMTSKNGITKLLFDIPVRGLLGYRNEFVVDTRGEGIFCSRMIGFKPYAGDIEKTTTGSMISMVTGKALGFSLFNLQTRGSLYIGANVEVYEGMVIGNVTKGNDMEVNPIKGKQLTNMRSSGADEAINLTTPVEMTIETGFGIMKEDEYLEITPENVRLRKKGLTKTDRNKAIIKK